MAAAIDGETLVITGVAQVTLIVRLATELPLPLTSNVVAHIVCVPVAENVKVAVVLVPPLDQLDT